MSHVYFIISCQYTIGNLASKAAEKMKFSHCGKSWDMEAED